MNNPQEHLWGEEYVSSPIKAARTEWGTPLPLARELCTRFGRGFFHLDVCASAWSVVDCFDRYGLDIGLNGLIEPWQLRGHLTSIWCNPPWDNIMPWIMKGVSEVFHLARCAVATYLLPSRTGSEWWQIASRMGDIYPIRGRVNFRQPPGVRKASTNPEDAVVVVFRQPLVASDYR